MQRWNWRTAGHRSALSLPEANFERVENEMGCCGSYAGEEAAITWQTVWACRAVFYACGEKDVSELLGKGEMERTVDRAAEDGGREKGACVALEIWIWRRKDRYV